MKIARAMAVAVLTLCICLTASAQKSGVVAKVNSQAIAEEEFQKTLVHWFGKVVLEEMIQAEVIAQAAKQAKLEVTDAQVEARLVVMQTSMDERAAAGQGEPFAIWLASHRLTVNNLRGRLLTELRLEGLVADKVNVTEAEVSDYYNKNESLFRQPAQVKISVISFRTHGEAEQIRAKIISGEMTWGDAAAEHNINPYTKEAGGEMGYRAMDGTALTKAAFALKRDGDVSEVIEYGGFANIVKREDRRNERIMPYEEVKDGIQKALTEERKLRAKKEMQSTLMKQARIQKFLEPPQETPETGGE